MADGAYEGKRHGRGGFASLKRGKDGLTGPERARLAGLKGAIAHSVNVLGHNKEEYEELWETTKNQFSAKSEH